MFTMMMTMQSVQLHKQTIDLVATLVPRCLEGPTTTLRTLMILSFRAAAESHNSINVIRYCGHQMIYRWYWASLACAYPKSGGSLPSGQGLESETYPENPEVTPRALYQMTCCLLSDL